MNYQHFSNLLGKRNSKKLAHNTYAVKQANGDIEIRLHQTAIVTYMPNGKAILSTGGWQTATTKDRLNKFGPVQIYQKDFVWYLSTGEVFKNGMIIIQ